MPSSKQTLAPKKDLLTTAAHTPAAARKADQPLQTKRAVKAARSGYIDTGYTHRLPTKQQVSGNGRRRGRNLILWNRPRMADKLLHCILHEVDRQGIKLDWDTIAHMFHPGSSGASLQQGVSRNHTNLLAEGHVAAPVFKKNKPYDKSIRGYVRDMTVEDKVVLRPVGYGEYIEDPKVNQPDALQVLGEIKAQLQAEEDFAPEHEAEPDFMFDDDISPATVITIPDHEGVATPPSPTPVRHAAPRQSVAGGEWAFQHQGLEFPLGPAAIPQQPISLSPVAPFADVAAATGYVPQPQSLQFPAGQATWAQQPVALSPGTQVADMIAASVYQDWQTWGDNSFLQLPREADLFPEVGNDFPFVIGTDNLDDPFNGVAPTNGQFGELEELLQYNRTH